MKYTCTNCDLNEDATYFVEHTHAGYLCYDCAKDLFPKDFESVVARISEMPEKMSADRRVREIKKMKSSLSPKIVKDPVLEEIFAEASPRRIFETLNTTIIGQEEAKKQISIAVNHHIKRIRYPHLKKSNILLIGPSGTGKTELFRAISQHFDIPMSVTDATTLTAAGYIGMDIEQVVLDLIDAAHGDIEKAEHGIILIDEIDKIAASGNDPTTINTSRVQAELLKMVEGNKIKVATNKDRNRPNYKEINTENILFIFAGAFKGLQTMIENRVDKSMGINADIQSSTNWQDQVETSHLTKFGMMPELLGRIPIVTFTKDLTPSEMRQVLTEPKNSLISQYKDLLLTDDVELEFDYDLLEDMALKAIKKEVGVRGLKSMLEKELKEICFNVEDYKGMIVRMTTQGPVATKKRKQA